MINPIAPNDIKAINSTKCRRFLRATEVVGSIEPLVWSDLFESLIHFLWRKFLFCGLGMCFDKPQPFVYTARNFGEQIRRVGVVQCVRFINRRARFGSER